MTTDNIKSSLTYNDKVIEKIVGHALENVDGLLQVSGGFFSNLKTMSLILIQLQMVLMLKLVLKK